MADDVRAILERMAKNFKELPEQFKVVGMSVRNTARSMSRFSGQQAAREDWGDSLWPDESGSDDDD